MKPGEAVILSEYRDHWLGELVLMWRASFEAGVGITDPHPIADQCQFFLERVLPENTVRIAVGGDQLVGFVAASRESLPSLCPGWPPAARLRVAVARLGEGTLVRWTLAVHICS